MCKEERCWREAPCGAGASPPCRWPQPAPPLLPLSAPMPTPAAAACLGCGRVAGAQGRALTGPGETSHCSLWPRRPAWPRVRRRPRVCWAERWSRRGWEGLEPGGDGLRPASSPHEPPQRCPFSGVSSRIKIPPSRPRDRPRDVTAPQEPQFGAGHRAGQQQTRGPCLTDVSPSSSGSRERAPSRRHRHVGRQRVSG